MLVTALGAWSIATIPIDAFPDVTNIQVEVVSTAPGLSPLEIERAVTYPVETVMRGLPGLVTMRSATKYGISALLDQGHWTGYQQVVVFLIALTIIFDGIDNQLLGIAIPAIMRDWGSPRAAFAPVLAGGMLGMMIGGALAGLSGDRFGRRTALLGSMTVFGLLTLAAYVGYVRHPFSLLRYLLVVMLFALGLMAKPMLVTLPLTLLLSWLDSQSWQRLVIVTILFFVGQAVEGNLITPRIVGRRLGLHALVVMLAVLVGGTLFGFVGMLLAVPTTAVLSVFWEDLRTWYLGSSFYRGQAPPAAQ